MPGYISLEDVLASRLEERRSRSQLRSLTSFPPESADFSSNSYLSLPLIPEVRQSYISFLESLASSSPTAPLFGSGGSRLLDGNTPFSEFLEKDIAEFHGAKSGLIFNSGFDANVGLFSCVPQPGDIIVYDELVHASIHDGMRMSRARDKIPFRHNRVEWETLGPSVPENARCLDEVLNELMNGKSHPRVKSGEAAVFIAVEGVYSMDGDVAPLQQVVECVRRSLPKGNGYIIVDEAHSNGIFGPEGRGLVSELGLEDKVFARVHTFGKALGSSGGKPPENYDQVRFPVHDWANDMLF